MRIKHCTWLSIAGKCVLLLLALFLIAAEGGQRDHQGQALQASPAAGEHVQKGLQAHEGRIPLYPAALETGSKVNETMLYWVVGGAVVLFLLLIAAVLSLMVFSKRLQNEVAVRRLAETAARQSEQRLATVIDQAADMIFFHDLRGRFQIVNQSACERLGYTKAELVQLSVEDIDAQFQGQNDLVEFWNNLKPGASTILETKLRSRKGELIPAEINLKLFQYKNEPWVLAVVRDIGRRKQTEAQLRRSYKMEALGTLSGGITHDFNNILGIILGSTELAMDDVPPANPARGCLEEIKTAARRARDIVRQILTFTRKGAEENKPVDLTAFVHASLKLVRATVPATIAIETNFPADKIVVSANETQISQIMVNLCANAAHAMKKSGGRINIELKQCQGKDPVLKAYPEVVEGTYAYLTVSDTGPGIEPEILDRIFDPYFTTKKGRRGSGMGLAVVHGTVKMMGGYIYSHSTVGKGTRMVVLLPVIDFEHIIPPDQAIRIPRGNERIMFVDDEPAMARYCKRMVERLGYHVEAYTDPGEALASFRSHPDDFDLVITDMTMPGMTGDKLAREMMNIRSDIAVVLCTGHSELLDEKEAMDMGIKAFHMKPFDRMELATTIRIVLDGRDKSHGRSDGNLDRVRN